jgi:squalene-hopene/tetraprenyl-beta-curcumene cyclase
VAGAQRASTHGLRIPGGFRGDRLPASPLRAGVERAARCLLGRQAPDGHWVGELQGDTILESEWVLLMGFLGREGDERVRKAARYILQQQQPEGGWSNYPDGPAEVSVSVKAYFALKLAGHDPEAPYMRRAREVIRALGGAARCNSFTTFYLALLGQFPYANCPAVPPELMLLPRWAYINIYAMSSWTRTIIVPLSIFYAHKPVRRLPPHLGIGEVFLDPPDTPLWPHPPTRRLLTWTNFFLAVDQLIKRCEDRLGFVRAAALRRAEAWMREHLADSGGLGAIFPPMIYTVVCLRCLGHADDSPEMQWALAQLDALMIEEGDTLRLQPCFSPVWDTALTLNALADAMPLVADADMNSSFPSSAWERTAAKLRFATSTSREAELPDLRSQAELGNESSLGLQSAMERGVSWLLAKEVRRPGDWSLANPGLEPGGWFFEYQNGFYPDTDDTAMVLMALAKTGLAAARPAAERGLRWLLGMQNRDGGWAAFDREINRELLTRVPFADHNAMLDPSCPDITGRALEALGHHGYGPDHPQVSKGLAFLERTQGPAGCWPGRWGVNYLYGTWQVLAGLGSIGYDPSRPMVRRAVAWLKAVQQPGGGWGESCRSYDDPSFAGVGTPTASQTAWALLGLIAAGEAESDAVAAGIDYLLATQGEDGGWQEEQFTGTGFPKVFYLKYHMYSLYFPLMALARYARIVGAEAHGPRVEAFRVVAADAE